MQSGQLQIETSTSTPSPEELAVWRAFLESAWAVIDILDGELTEAGEINLRWYDVLAHLEDAPDGVRMSEVADRILASKSGLTRVIDRMSDEGLVRRERPADDRRVVRVYITPEGTDALARARVVHRRGIAEHFLQHLDADDRAALTKALGQIRDHVRPLRPGRVTG